MALSGETEERRPWRQGNQFTLLVNGENIFPVMLEAIGAAQSRLLMEMYLVESGALLERFIEALRGAADRGVTVYLLFDGFGSLGLREADRRRLNYPGIHCEYYNPLRFGRLRSNLLRDHRKLLVVDERLAFVGGAGITDEFDIETRPTDYWHDVVVQVQGANVRDWAAAFAETWAHWTKQDLPGQFTAPLAQPQTGGQSGRVINDKRFGKSVIQRDFIRHVRGAEQRVWMMTAYFVPAARLRRALRRAARRGVDVRLLLPGPISDHPAVRYAGWRYYHALLSAGVRIFEYQPRFLHGKLLLADHWVSIGSNNLDRWNLRWNLEANQEVDDEAFAGEIQVLFESDFALSDERQLEQWQRRSPYHRLLEWFWGRIDALLERLGQYLQRG